MATVIRLKRRVDEDPLNAFVLNCKRQRTAEQVPFVASNDAQAATSTDNGNGETSTVLKFAGTFQKADNISAHLQQRLSKEEARNAIARVHPRPISIASRNRAANRQASQNSRFRIVNCVRSLSQTDDGLGGAAATTTTIVDVERDNSSPAPVPVPASASSSSSSKLTSQQQPTGDDGEDGYVYDLYMAEETAGGSSSSSVHIPYIPNNLDDISVAVWEDPLYSSHRGLGDRSDDSGEEKSEDSNSESNWRNDYPDEDEDVFGGDNSVDEEDMRRAVEEFDLDGDRDLSSDDEYFDGETAEIDPDKIIYSGRAHNGFNEVDDDDDDDEDDEDEGLNPQDVAQFGTAYARYKARVMGKVNKKKPSSRRRAPVGIDSDEYDDEISGDNSDEYRSSSASGSESDNLDLYD
ncbi:probable RNA polymerase II nuclear localization protein SLC7A6OS [Uranotaenia lowii]|uniref:probable RNA polymerase II nuclear localization protein SLC7A6OS n=1 Tax=Uranotaenia lowii TaxID=190385 RepID=UPI00247A3420|nr:probable RNA polymerase II nuclear localization protein SLC7A6OS [Uranotaenia lowii]